MTENCHLYQKILSKNVIEAFDKLFDVGVENIEFQPTKKEFEGDITIVIFPFVKLLKQNPKEIAEKLGEHLCGQWEDFCEPLTFSKSTTFQKKNHF